MAQIYLQQLEDFCKKTWTLINERLKPNPQYTQTHLQQEIIHKRNKAVFAMFFVYQFFFIYDILSAQNSFIKNLASLVAIYTSIFTLFLSCRYHPQIFNSYQNIMGLLFGPLILDAGPESLIYAVMTANFTPLLVQVVTGSYTHYILNSLGQLALLNTLYKNPIKEMISLNPPEEVQHYLTANASFVLFLQTFVVVLLHRFLAQTQEQTLVLEQKKNEAEIQKTFFLSFSHELKNLVNSLIGNVKLASIENIGGRAKGILQNAEVCGELLLHMINNILDSGKAAIGDLEVDPIPTKTYEAFERIWGICSELIRRKDLKGYMKIPKNLPRIMMLDQHRLTQIFLNLIDNAIKFTEKGSIEIKVEWLPNRNIVNEKCFQPYPFNICDEQDEGLFEKQQSFTNLDEHYSILGTAGKGVGAHQLLSAPVSRKGVLKMIVTDKGCGMSKEQIDKLFQKFTQVTTDATKKKLGTGLGLFITKELCHRMNGEIRVFSKKSCGSSFVFCIPVDVVFDNNQFLGNQEILRQHLISKILRAMIVDDIPSNHTILKAFFENVGIQVSSIALNGLEAYRKYAEYGPQIIAMDLDMPIMDGKLASQKIRDLEEEKGLGPVFLMIISENCIESELFECVDKKGRIRADAVLKKPLRIGDLTGAIASRFLYE